VGERCAEWWGERWGERCGVDHSGVVRSVEGRVVLCFRGVRTVRSAVWCESCVYASRCVCSVADCKVGVVPRGVV